MDIPASLVPSSSWRAEVLDSETDFGSVFFQPNRLDVLVHLLAFEHLAGDDIAPDEAQHWVELSDVFAAQANEPTVATLAAELMTSPEAALHVTFGSGGRLVRGATAAAASIYSGRPAIRREGTDKVIDRSIEALSEAGWTTAELRQLLIEWAERDEAAMVVLVDLDADGADEALHELSCRYATMHDELDFVSAADAEALQADGTGSTQVMCLRATGDQVSDVLSRHAGAIRCSSAGPTAASVLGTLWRAERDVQTSPEHIQRIRKMRRRELTDQLLVRTLGR